MGIRTFADLRSWQRPALEDAFGPRSGAWLHARGNLLDETPVTPEHETKSQSTEITFDVDVSQRAELERHLGELSDELCRRLRKRELEGRTIGIKVRLDDWTNVTRSHTIEQPTNDPAVVGPAALELLRAYDPQRPVRLLGVRVASFSAADAAEPEPTPGQLRLGLAS
jgi:DNA polymerase-4